MATKVSDREFFAGDSIRFRFTVTDADNDNEPLVLTGYTIRWALSKKNASGQYSETPVLEKNSSDPAEIEIVDENAGICEVIILTADTDGFVPGNYYQELEIVGATSQHVVVGYGNVKIKKKVTNT